jgi:hypothetical protein
VTDITTAHSGEMLNALYSVQTWSARRCWLNQKCVDEQSYLRGLEARETKYIPPVTLTPIALEITHRDLTNRYAGGEFRRLDSAAWDMISAVIILPG